MGKYVLERLVSMLVTLFIIITITFALMHSIPGGPFTGEKKLPPEILNALNKKYHLDQPIFTQYTNYLGSILKGDLGPSFKVKGETVNNIIATSFPASGQLGLVALVLILVIGVPLGIVAALKQGTWVDNMVMFIAVIGVTIPSFVIAAFLIYIFALKLQMLPAARWGTFQHMIMPSVGLAAYSLAFIARLTRSTMLEVVSQDYIRTARAKGLSEGVVIYKHALKNALIPIVTYLGPLISGLLVGSFVIEKIFAVPGLGRYFVESITNRDYTVIMGVTIFDAIILVLLIFIVDLLYGIIDPRIKLDK